MEFINQITIIAVIIATTFIVLYLFNIAAKKFLQKNLDIEPTKIRLLMILVKIIAWITAIILIFSNLGYNVNSLIASLGIGGIAVALAVQNILGDIFNSFTIYLDKPFKEGDSIAIGDLFGTVKKIGLKSTRIESINGEELIISNKDLTSSRVKNYNEMKNRRSLFTIRISPETSVQKLEKIPELIKNIIDKVEQITFSRAYLKDIGEMSYIYEIVFYVDNKDYQLYTEKQQEVNLLLIKKLAQEDIQLIFNKNVWS